MHPSQETDTGIHLSSWKNIYLEALRGNDGTVVNSTVLPASVNSSPVHPLDQIKQMWEPVWTHHCFSHALVPTYDPSAARQVTSGSDPDCPHLSPAEPLHPSPNATSIDGFLPGLQLRPPGTPSLPTEIKVNSVETCNTCFKPTNNFLSKLLTEVYRPSKIYSLKASPVLFLFVLTKHPLCSMRGRGRGRIPKGPETAQEVSLTPSPLSPLLTGSFTTLLEHFDVLCAFN